MSHGNHWWDKIRKLGDKMYLLVSRESKHIKFRNFFGDDTLETKRYILSPLTFLFLSHQGFPWLILRRWMPLDAPAATYFPYPFCTQIRSGRMSYYTAYSIIRPCTGFRSVKLRRLYWNSHPNWIGYTFNISVVSSRLPAHTNTLKKWPSGQTVFVCATYKWQYVTSSPCI